MKTTQCDVCKNSDILNRFCRYEVKDILHYEEIIYEYHICFDCWQGFQDFMAQKVKAETKDKEAK